VVNHAIGARGVAAALAHVEGLAHVTLLVAIHFQAPEVHFRQTTAIARIRIVTSAGAEPLAPWAARR